MKTTNLPPGWGLASLKDLVRSVRYGLTASATYAPVGPRFLRITDLQDNEVNWDTVPFCQCNEDAKFRLRPGDIVVARTGATTGKSQMIDFVPEPTVFASYLIRLEAIDECISSYLARFMKSEGYWKQITTVKQGMAQPGVNATLLSGLEVPVAPLNEQRRIVAKIEELTARSRRAREALEAVPPLLEQLRQSVLAAAFSGRLTADWREKNKDLEPASVLLDRIRAERRRRWEKNELTKLRAKGKEPKDDRWKAKYNEPDPVDPTGLPELPEGWCWASVAELGDVVTGTTPSSKSQGFFGVELPFVTPTDLDSGFNVKTARRYLSRKGAEHARVLPAGSVMVTCIGATIGKTGVARVECTTNQQVNSVLPPRELVATNWLYWHFVSPFGYRSVLDNSSSTTLPILNKSRFEELAVAIPPLDEQKIIDGVLRASLEAHDDVLMQISSLLGTTHTLDQSILARAFRGELVPQDPNDEPASILLERIRARRAAAEADKKEQRSSRALRLRGQEENRKDGKTAMKEPTTDDPLQAVLHYLQSNPGPHSKQDILTNTNLDPTTWSTVAPELANHPIDRTGDKRGTRYEWKDR